MLGQDAMKIGSKTLHTAVYITMKPYLENKEKAEQMRGADGVKIAVLRKGRARLKFI